MRPAALLAITSLTASLLSGCGTSTGTGATGAADDYPVTVENCGVEVTFDKPPERVFIANSAPVQYLASLDLLDRLASRAGRFPTAYYSSETAAAIKKVTSLTEELTPDGHLNISQEEIIAQDPDLVLGLPEGVTRESLSAADIPVIVEPSFCPEGIDRPGYDTVYDQMRLYGKVFDRADQADDAIAALRDRIDQVEARLPQQERRTAAVLWPYRGQGTVGAYGKRSMADPQLTSLGYTNVFGDTDQRVFETSMEQLLDRDPDIIVLLHTDGTDTEIKQALLDLPGADRLTAVRTGQVMVQLFNFTEPPTPLVLDGLEHIAARSSTN